MKSTIKKYLEGTASEKEQQELLEWLENKENHVLYKKYKAAWKNSIGSHYFPAESKNAWLDIQTSLLNDSYKRFQRTKKLLRFFRYAALALIIVTIGLTTWYWTSKTYNLQVLETKLVADNGQISRLQLSDGTNVWLNSGSELVYNNLFATENRIIKLNGEAYFDVDSNNDLPFIVKMEELQVEVTGTQFNISAYEFNDFTEIVLEEGSVMLKQSDGIKLNYQLQSGEKARYIKSEKRIEITTVNTEKYTSWKTGTINIYDQKLSNLVKQLENRYNLRFSYSEEVKNIRYTFSISNESLDEVISLMEKITPVKAVSRNDTIVFVMDK